MKNILHELYYGRLSGWERRPVRTAENRAINGKIEAEKQYFVGKMSLDDCQRFQALESLYTQAHEFDEIDAFFYGFRLGVRLMIAVFSGDECGGKPLGDDCAER